MDQHKPARAPEVVSRKAIAGDMSADSPRRKLVSFLKDNGIIAEKCTGLLVLTFQDGGLRSSKLELIDPV